MAGGPGVGVVDHRSRPVRLIRSAAAGLVAAGVLIVGTAALMLLAPPRAGTGALWLPAAGVPAPVPAPAPPSGPPTRVRIPSIAVDAKLQTLVLDSTGALTPPVGYVDAGWYALGPAPGDLGAAVLAGHVDSTSGPAVFYRLRDLTAGAVVEVQRGGVWLSFQVVAVQRYPKNDFPTAQVYGPTPDAQLRLITCGGTFAQGSYRDNVVVYAIAN